MKVELLSGACGAEIADIDLRDTSDDNINIVKDLLYEHKVIFFRNQDINHNQANGWVNKVNIWGAYKEEEFNIPFFQFIINFYWKLI